MPRVGRRLSLLLLLSTVHGLSNTTIFPDLATSQSDGGHWLSLPPGDGVAVSGVNRLGIPGLPLPSLLSSLLGPQPIATPGAPLPVPTVAQASPTVPQGPQLTPQIGDAGVLGGLLSALNTLLSPIASLADAVPVPPLPLPVSQPDFSSLASLDLAPLSLVPQLVSEILPLIPQLSTDLPEAIPLLANLESILDAELAAGVPQVGILTSAIAAEVTALEGQIFSGTSLAVAAVPVLTVELPSLTMALPVASELSALSRLSEIPLSELPEVLSQIVDPLNVELVSSVVGAIVSTLDSMVLNSEVQSLADAVTVVGGSSEMLVTQEWCSQLTVVDGNVVMASAPCNEALNTAVPEPTINSAPHFTDVPFAGLTITNSHSPAVTFLPPQPSQPQVQQTSSPAAPIIPNPAPSPPQVQQTSTPAAPIIPTPAPITITATVTQLSTITTCSPTSLPLSAFCPSVAPCPQCPAPTPCTPLPTLGSNSGTDSTGGGPQGPCPGKGYTCNDCPDGWFCPPVQTPAGPAPCGNGWPCYHCPGGWFCVPQPVTSPAAATACPASSSTGVEAQGRQPPSESSAAAGQAGAPGNGEPGKSEGDEEAETTVTATTVMTISDTSLPAVTEHPAVAGSKYVGCYRDSASRALKNASITTPIPGGMTNEICIKFCLGRGFSLAATEYGFECYCGEVLEDSWLMGDSDCNKPCPGDATCNCGGSWAMSLWNADDGEVPKAFGPQEHFVAPPLLPGETDVHVYAGGLRQTVVLVTTPVYEWPAESPSPSSSSSSSYASDIDIAALAANIHAIVSAAMKQAQGLAMSEVARAKSMGRLPERVAKAIDSTTITTCSATTTLTTTVICTESTGSSVVSNSLTPLVPPEPPRQSSASVTIPSNSLTPLVPHQSKVTGTTSSNSLTPLIPPMPSLSDLGSDSLGPMRSDLTSSDVLTVPESVSAPASQVDSTILGSSIVSNETVGPTLPQGSNQIIIITVTTTALPVAASMGSQQAQPITASPPPAVTPFLSVSPVGQAPEGSGGSPTDEQVMHTYVAMAGGPQRERRSFVA